jgi:hypothetical protein
MANPHLLSVNGISDIGANSENINFMGINNSKVVNGNEAIS